MPDSQKYDEAIRYIRQKIDQMLVVMGTLPLRQEELDDDTLIALDPIGIVVESFSQVLEHLNETNHKLSLSQSEIRTIFDTVDAAIVVYLPDGTMEDCNAQACAALFNGREYEELQGKRLEDIGCCHGHVEKEVLASDNQSGEYQLDGRWYSISAKSVLDERGELEKTVFLYTDITEQKWALKELGIYASVFDNTAEGILVADADTNILYINRAFSEITGYGRDEVVGKKPNIFQSGMHDAEFYKEMWASLYSSDHWRGEILDRRKDGTLIPLWQALSCVRDDKGGVTNYISVIHDISPLKETQTQLDHLAHHDPLTDLPNRLLLQDRLTQAIRRGLRSDNSTAVLFIDLDRFKTINDSLGHHVGDLLLRAVAKRLTTILRSSDSVARLGGDEFVIMLEDLGSRKEAEQMANKVITALREPFVINQHELHIGCSIGISIAPEDGKDTNTLLKNADTAMYQVKDSGRDGFHVYSMELSEKADEKLRIENALRKVIREKGFYLQYQPIVDAYSERVISAEALLRWRCVEFGDVSPARFIPVAEESNLIIPIGNIVLDLAVEQYLVWREQGIELDYLSVNVSGPQLYHGGFASDLIDILKQNSISGDHFQVEITENVLMDNMERCVSQLNKLREYGIRIAIDDFGTGYSSLSYLRSLPLDIIKVDRSFVSDIPGDKNDSVIAHAIVSLAQSLELESIAEGIETDEQRDFMRSIGCHRFQGFYYSRPLMPDEFAAYWRANQL